MIKEIYIYRKYLSGAFWADLRYRYAGTALGFFWFFLVPLFETAIYAVVFTNIIPARTGGKTGLAYTVFLVSGLFPWLTFSQMISRGSNAINSNSIYIRRSLIPINVFIFKDALISLFTFLIYLVFIVVISIIANNPIRITAILIPFLAIMITLLGYGISISLAYLRVMFPDIGEIIMVALQLWRWTLPIMYSDDTFPGWLQKILRLNPPYYFIRSFRDVLLNDVFPSWQAWAVMFFWLILFFMIGSFVARKLHDEVKDLL